MEKNTYRLPDMPEGSGKGVLPLSFLVLAFSGNSSEKQIQPSTYQENQPIEHSRVHEGIQAANDKICAHVKTVLELDSMQSHFFYEQSREKFAAGYTTILQIQDIYDMCKSEFSLLGESDLLAIAREESRFGYDSHSENQKGIYQIMAVVLADIVERYEKYAPHLTGEVAQVFGFEPQDTIPVDYFKKFFISTEYGYRYTDEGHKLIMDTKVNGTIAALYLSGIEVDIEKNNLKNFNTLVEDKLAEIDDNGHMSESFAKEMKRYIRGKGLEFDEQLMSDLYQQVNKNPTVKKRFKSFVRFNGNKNYMMYYGFKCLYYSRLFQDGLHRYEAQKAQNLACGFQETTRTQDENYMDEGTYTTAESYAATAPSFDSPFQQATNSVDTPLYLQKYNVEITKHIQEIFADIEQVNQKSNHSYSYSENENTLPVVKKKITTIDFTQSPEATNSSCLTMEACA